VGIPTHPEVDERFEGVDKQLTSLNKELSGFKRQTLATQDEMLTILRRLDEERVTTGAWLSRIDKDVERLKEKVGIRE